MPRRDSAASGTIVAAGTSIGVTEHRADLADALAAAVVRVPGVVALHAGMFGEVATYLPGRRVIGVRVRDDGVEVHVVLRYGAPVLGAAQAVRAAVQSLRPGTVHVTVQDVVHEVDVSGTPSPVGRSPWTRSATPSAATTSDPISGSTKDIGVPRTPPTDPSPASRDRDALSKDDL